MDADKPKDMNRFALIGAAGFVAPRHMKAIADTGNTLVAAMDRNDSVGVIDSFFPEAHFFTEFERLDRHLHLLQREGAGVEYVSICSPNYLHDSHARFAMRSGAHAICEKPLVLNPWNIDGLKDIEQDTGRKINTILQLRLHTSVNELRDRVASSAPDRRFDVDLTYITSRGKWYQSSWKGDESKSGGIATNIGVHFFDMLHYVFGALQENALHFTSSSSAGGYLEYEKARVRWFLSIDAQTLPAAIRNTGQRTHRSLSVDGEEFEFSGGFEDLHTRSYEQILNGEGFGLEDNRTAIETVATLRDLSPDTHRGEVHPILAARLAGR